MEYTLKRVSLDEKSVLAHLIEKYEYEFSKWNKLDVDSNGLYGYEYLDTYWIDSTRHPFFIFVADKLAGFAMINAYPEYPLEEVDFVMSEFFVMQKYRRQGIGSQVTLELFQKFKGSWQLKMHPMNTGSCDFWRRITSRVSTQSVREINDYAEAIYEDGSFGIILLFET